MGGAAPVIVTVVAVAASVVAGPAVGAAIFEATTGMDAIAAVGTGFMTASEVATTTAALGSAAIAGSTAAVNAAIQGKNIEGVLEAGAKGAATGAVSGAIGSEVAQGVTDVTGTPTPGVEQAPNAAGNIAGSTAGGATSGFTKAELSGSNLQQALKQGEIGAATGFATSALGEGLKGAGVPSETAKDITTVASPFVGQNIANLFTPQTSSQTVGRPGESSVTTTGQAGTTPGSQALAQALQVGSPDVGAPVQSPGGGESAKQPVWNVASLRTMDQTGSPDSGSSA